MEPPLRSIGIPIVVLMILLGFLLIVPTDTIAQDRSSGGGGDQLNDFHEKKLEIPESEQASPTLDPVMSGVDLNSLNGDYMIFEHDQMWNRNPNPNPEWDFPLFEQGEPAGNINGDDRDDFIVTGQTGSLTANTWKTAVFFGGNSSGEPDDIIERKLVPVGDLNGDGRADAVAVDNPDTKSVEIYEGTDFGYSATGATLSKLDPANFNILGFQDFNGDDRKDIFSYSATIGDVKITLGQINFGDMTVDDSYNGVLSSSPKKVFAKDIDGNNSVEIVEFYGSNGDGQIQVLEFLDLTFLQKIYPFGFNPAFEDASNTDLHLIDVNGDSYDDIYISLGRKSPKYVLEYDAVTGDYASPIEILDGALVPAGDLNSDGNHDFIMGDPDNNYSPHIAFGPDNLSTSLSLDVELGGNSGISWDWEMGYNPYSSFGDLNGDDVDDALLSHTEYGENSVNYGRRALFGSEGMSSDNSEFQLYPREYFHNAIYEVEELGDINGDGIDDFAMVLADQGKIEIYHGSSSILLSPDQSFSSGYYLESMTRGDFTGDGINDIVTISQAIGGLQIEVFEGGNPFNRIKSINVSDFQDAEIISVSGVNDIGDINGSGISDFLIGSGRGADTTGGDVYLNEAYIFHGGSSISSTPDDILDMDPQNDFASEHISAGESATALGDLDDDGLGDFAVGSPLKGNGEVSVYLSGSSESKLLTSPSGSYFGSDIVPGDFNGDGLKDLAVSVAFTDTIAKIYYGKEDFNTVPDQTLPLPDFYSDKNESSYMIPSLETIPDFNNDGKDELLVGSSGVVNNHAILFSDVSNSSGASLIKGANPDAALGGNNFVNKYGTMATGDFTTNGELDVIISQYNDNSDGFFSSRVYRYELSLPLSITAVEDVPEDQGGKVRINIEGKLLGSTSDFDSLGVQRLTQNGEWQTLITDTDPGASSYDVSVPKTQPTNNDEVDNSYTFRVVAFTDTIYTSSQEISGRAFDNIAPPQVNEVNITEENDSKVISWQGLGTSDLDSYFIYRIKDSGELSDRPLAVVEKNEYTLSDSFDGIQQFVVRARDIHNNFGESSVPVNAVYPKTVKYDFNAGWNLITLAVEDDSANSVLQDLTSGPIYEYIGGYREVEQVEEGGAYWIKFVDAANPEFRGLPLVALSVELSEGWNLIGSVGGELPVSFIDDPDEIIIPETIYSFDNAYINTDTLGPTKGYWIRTSSAGTVTLTHPKFLEQQSKELNKTENSLAKSAGEITELFNKITVSDDEHSAELYFGSKLPNGIDKRMFSLPPLPPGDVFDARFEGDMRLTENDKVDIRLNTIAGKSLKMKIKAGSAAKENQFVIKEFADGEFKSKHIVNDSEEITLKHKETDSITLTPVGISEVRQQEIPDEFDLEQNYPNPFNPTTQIQYSVAEATDVKIDVFNILGRRIVTLVNKRQEPGTYEVTFDGSNFASGIYLYRLQAGDYISTKKFILAK